MVDFDTAVAAVQDPNADPVLLAKIAYENPEFGANVVVNSVMNAPASSLRQWGGRFRRKSRTNKPDSPPNSP